MFSVSRRGPRQVKSSSRHENDVVTTLWYRAPEVALKDPTYGEAIDVWSLGLTVAEIAGTEWHQGDDLDAVLSAYYLHLGSPPAHLRAKWLIPAHKALHQRSAWPRAVRDLLGAAGENLLDQHLVWDPAVRVSAEAALRHQFFSPWALQKPGGRAAFAGSRHPWSIVTGSCDVALVQWLRADFASTWATDLKLDFQAARADVKTEDGRKFIMSGRMSPDVASSGMCTLSLAAELPTPRLRAFFAAFKLVNQAVLNGMADRLRAMATGLPPDGADENRRHFLQQPVASWFLNAAELCITEAAGSWQEPLHQDGAASAVHMGVTLWGRRLMVCQVPDEPDVVVSNHPGVVYLGGLTGPHHQVTHQPSHEDELLDGRFSVAIMLRTTLFPFCRSRVRGTTPHSPAFFFGMAEIVAESVGNRRWILPSLEACLAQLRPMSDWAASASPRGTAARPTTALTAEPAASASPRGTSPKQTAPSQVGPRRRVRGKGAPPQVVRKGKALKPSQVKKASATSKDSKAAKTRERQG